MTIESLLIFAAALAVVAGSPGPSIAALVSRVLQGGAASVLPFLAAMWIGEAAWLTAAILGISAIADLRHWIDVGLFMRSDFGQLSEASGPAPCEHLDRSDDVALGPSDRPSLHTDRYAVSEFVVQEYVDRAGSAVVHHGPQVGTRAGTSRLRHRSHGAECPRHNCDP